MKPEDALEAWLADPRSPTEAPGVWREAREALPHLPATVGPELRARAIDRFLDELPLAIYGQLEQIDPAHWPAVTDALARAGDLEAQLLRAVPAHGFLAMARFVAQIAPLVSPVRTAAMLSARPELCTQPVVEACLQVLHETQTSLIQLGGPIEAVRMYGTPAQRTALFAVLERIERVERTAPRFARKYPSPARPRLGQASPQGAALLAAVYENPAADEPRAIYADWLLEQGHPLGELIQLQLARAQGRGGSLAAEQRIFRAHRGALWPDHPCVLGDSTLDFERLDRGFPARFERAYLPFEERAKVTSELRARIAGHPGWATVRSLRDHWDARLPITELLPPRMPLLDEILSLRMATLDRLRDRAWPVRRLALEVSPGDPPVRAVTGLRDVRELSVSAKVPLLADLIGVLAPTNLLARIERLVVTQAAAYHARLATTLDFVARLPRPLVELVIDNGMSSSYRVTSDRALTVVVNATRLDEVAEELAACRAPLASVNVILATQGGFSPDTRVLAHERLHASVAHLPHATVTDGELPGEVF